MSQPPIDWDHYEIPLETPGGKKPPESLPSGPSEPQRVRPIGSGPPVGRRILSFLLWWALAVVVALAVGIGVGYLFETVLYEKLWGAMPANEPAFSRWLDERVAMTRVAIVFGCLVGGALVKLLHGFWHRND